MHYLKATGHRFCNLQMKSVYFIKNMVFADKGTHHKDIVEYYLHMILAYDAF